MALSDSAIMHQYHPARLGVNNQTAGWLGLNAGGGILAMATQSIWPAVIAGAFSCIVVGGQILKAVIERDGRRKEERIRHLEAELLRAAWNPKRSRP